MRAGVLPCTALIHECNAGNIISPEACLGAFITCNYAETVPYQLSGKQKTKQELKPQIRKQFWAVGCSPGWTVKKKVLADYEQLLRHVFLSFHG
jgi:hypothetical protein